MTKGEKRLLRPAWFLVTVAIMVALHVFLPGYRWLAWQWKAIGALSILAGLLVVIVADKQFKHHGTTIKPFQTSSALVTDGVFRYSRNPMYLGMVLVLIGIAICLGSVTPLILLPVFAWLITGRFIQTEEKALQDQFGQHYVDYQASVRRWR